MEEGQLSRWLKKEGDKVSIGEPIAEVDTDKATMEMQALASGVLKKIIVNEGESAPLGQVIAIIGEPDEDVSGLVSQTAATAGASQPKKEDVKDRAAGAADERVATAAEAPKAGAVTEGQPIKADVDRAAQVGKGDSSQSQGAGNGRMIVSPLAAAWPPRLVST